MSVDLACPRGWSCIRWIVLIVLLCCAGIAKEAEGARTGHGTALPRDGFSAATFRVECYHRGYALLNKAPGVFGVVKGYQWEPLKEWNVVYFDPSKISVEGILERLHAGGCPRAYREKPRTQKDEVSGVEAVAENPIGVPGDCFLITVAGAKRRPEVSVPEGWTVVAREKDRIVVQSPADGKRGAYEVAVKTSEVELKLPLALHKQVRMK